MRRTWGVAGLALVLVGLGAWAPHSLGPPPPGRYSSVRYIAEAGDDLGVNLEILEPGPRPMVFYEACEGVCPGGQRFRASIVGDTLTFTFREDDLADNHGQPAAPIVYRVAARWRQTRAGPRLIVTSPDARDVPPEFLKRLR